MGALAGAPEEAQCSGDLESEVALGAAEEQQVERERGEQERQAQARSDRQAGAGVLFNLHASAHFHPAAR